MFVFFFYLIKLYKPLKKIKFYTLNVKPFKASSIVFISELLFLFSRSVIIFNSVSGSNQSKLDFQISGLHELYAR